MMWGRLCAWMTESVATIGWEARADSYVYDLGMVVWCAWMTKRVSKMGWWQTISSVHEIRHDQIFGETR